MEKERVFESFSKETKMDMCDKSIIKDENDEDINVTMKDYIFVLSNFYGNRMNIVYILMFCALRKITDAWSISLI